MLRSLTNLPYVLLCCVILKSILAVLILFQQSIIEIVLESGVIHTCENCVIVEIFITLKYHCINNAIKII